MTRPDGLRLEFEGELTYWRGPSPYHFVTVPDEGCAALRAVAPMASYGWGVIPVQARVGDTRWQTSLFPKDGRYLLPVRDSVRKAKRISLGDEVAVELLVRI